MRASTTCVVILLCAKTALGQAPRDTTARLDSVAREVVRLGARYGNAIWPGFRPDTIPLSFVVPSHGDLLFGWRGRLPRGYTPIAQFPQAAWRDQRALGAASTGTMLEGRRVAQVVVSTLDPAVLAATAMHEAFHVFEGAAKRADAKFGRGENSMLVSTYPVFDVDDETSFALEGKILAAALAAPSITQKRELAREFVAVRRERHRRLPSEFAEFDQLSELNEGLAEYALVRALQLESSEGPREWRAGAERALASRQQLLSELTGTENLSLRFRYYQTGPAEALLLDALDPTWKSQMLAQDATLQDMLARASGIDYAAITAEQKAHETFSVSGLRLSATHQIERLKASRRATADSLLSLPGIRLVLAADSLSGKDFNSCGYDPQNLLQVMPGVQIQMRWWKPCAGGPTYAEFNVPSVHDESAGKVSAVIGNEVDVKLSSNGKPLVIHDGETRRDVLSFKLDAPRASVQAVRVDIMRSGATLTIWPKSPGA
jgi:hypothetical protein